MGIKISRIGDRYRAKLTPPHGAWRTPEPEPLDDLIAALFERGCHQTDIGTALFDADPEWETRTPPRTPPGKPS